MTLSYDAIRKPINYTDSETLSVRSLVRRHYNTDVEENSLNLDPDYQRDHVWTEDQAHSYMGHLLEGGASPQIIINRANRDSIEIPDEVVDGKQRITAIVRWATNKIPALLSDGRKVYLRDFTPQDQRYILGMNGIPQTLSYVSLPKKDVYDLYIRLNEGGTVHPKKEIDRVKALRAAAS